MSRETTFHIDLTAINDNVQTLKRHIGDRHFMAVVKADAYGHGAVPVAAHIEKRVDAFAVAFTEEAVALREKGIRKPILILEGPHTRGDLDVTVALDLWPVLHNPDQLEWAYAKAHSLSCVWLKADTGMHRLGFNPDQMTAIRTSFSGRGISSVIAMSHLASAEQPTDPLTLSQQAEWQTTVSDWPDDVSLCNSAASQLGQAERCEWARIGYAMYGGQIPGSPVASLLTPAMHFTSAVIALRQIPQGESVGYGGRWVAARDSVIATLSAGYGDGYPRSAKSGAPVGINGQIAPLAGTVSMDLLSVDVTDCHNIEVGMPATLWGSQPAVDTVASYADTIGYELLTRVTGRPKRSYYTETHSFPSSSSSAFGE
ncbi:MAG: alanine racemase [Luminiphilus sp.]|jgi:alanine racemase|nr:alanine racemase [Luminiphilus sp.]